MKGNVQIDEDELIDLTSRLVAERSENPPGEEAGVADVLLERLLTSPVAFEVDRQDVEPGRPNVVACAGNSADAGTVLLTGHMDVVPATPEDWTGDPYELRFEGARVVGRGTADMKGALAAKVLAAESYLADDPAGEVVLAFVVDEEDSGRGTQTLIERGIDADYAIIGEPTRLRVCTAQKGVARYSITVRGESAHTGTPEKGSNAVSGLNRLIDRIEAFHDERQRETSHPLLAPETLTVTEIEGGIAPNVVPDRARLTVDWRILPGGPTQPEPFDRRVEALVDDITIDGEPIDATVERLVFARGAEIDPGHELVAAATDAGVESEPVGFNAATDARFLIHDAGIPTVLFGTGSIEDDAHTVDESVNVNDLVATAETYRDLLDRLLG